MTLWSASLRVKFSLLSIFQSFGNFSSNPLFMGKRWKHRLFFFPFPLECFIAKVQSEEIDEVLTFPKPTHSYIGLGWPLGCGEFIVTLNALKFSRFHPKIRILHLFKSCLAKSSLKDFCKMRSHRTYNDIKYGEFFTIERL